MQTRIIAGTVLVLIILSLGVYKALSHKQDIQQAVQQPIASETQEIEIAEPVKMKSSTPVQKEIEPKNLSLYHEVIEQIVSQPDTIALVAWALSDNDKNSKVSAPSQESLRVYVQCVEYNKSGVSEVEKKDCNKVHNKTLTTLLFRQ